MAPRLAFLFSHLVSGLSSPVSPWFCPIAFALFQEAAFLPLDDIPEGKHIDIDIGVGMDTSLSCSYSSTRRRNRRRSSIAPNASFLDNATGSGNAHIDLGGLGGLSEGINLNTHKDGGNVPDITRPPMFLMEQDYGNSFKMSTCAPQQQVITTVVDSVSVAVQVDAMRYIPV